MTSLNRGPFRVQYEKIPLTSIFYTHAVGGVGDKYELCKWSDDQMQKGKIIHLNPLLLSFTLGWERGGGVTL